MAGIESQMEEVRSRKAAEAASEAKAEAREAAAAAALEDVAWAEAERRIHARYEKLMGQSERRAERTRWRAERQRRVRTTKARLKTLYHDESEDWKLSSTRAVAGGDGGDGDGDGDTGGDGDGAAADVDTDAGAHPTPMLT